MYVYVYIDLFIFLSLFKADILHGYVTITSRVKFEWVESSSSESSQVRVHSWLTAGYVSSSFSLKMTDTIEGKRREERWKRSAKICVPFSGMSNAAAVGYC